MSTGRTRALRPPPVTEPDAGTFVERENDLHLHRLRAYTMSQVRTSSASMSVRAARPAGNSMNFGFTP